MGWDYLEGVVDKIAWLADPARHFLFSAILGYLVYCRTLTILSARGWEWEHLTQRKVSSAAVYIMELSSLLVGIAAALALHYVLDYGWLAYTLPLNPPLDLTVP